MADTTATEGAASNDRFIASDNYDHYVRARDAGHSQFVRDAEKYDNFYMGDQWDKADLAKLEGEGRPAQTINLTLSTINTMSGELTANQVDFNFKPKRGAATETMAGVLTRLSMSILDANKYDFCEKQVFDDMLITGRGYLDVRMDFDGNILGEVTVAKLHPREVLLDPTAREYDPSTWNEVILTRWLSLDEIEALYGADMAVRLRTYAGASTIGDDSIRYDSRTTFGDKNATFVLGETRDTGRTIRQVRVIERQYYKLARVREIVDMKTGEARPLPESWSEEKVALFAEAKGGQIRTRVTRRIRWTTSADCVLLSDTWSPYYTFTVIPFFCYFRPGKIIGAVKNLVGPQEILNKVESQKLHVVNTTANSGWIVDTGALQNMTVSELEQRGAETGLIIEKTPDRVVEKITPNQIPTGLDRVGQTAALSIREISGVNAAMLGQEGAEVSGVALENKTGRGSLQMQTIRENVRFSRTLLGRKLIELVQRFYSEERIFYIVGPDGETEELMVNQMDAIGQITNDLTAGEYEVTVGTMPARDSFEDSQFAQALAMREAGVMIPDHRIVGFSGLYRKQELVEEVKQITGFGEMTEQQQQLQELQMQTLTAELNQMLADIENTQANSQLTMAKAGAEGDKPVLEREKLQVGMATTQVEQATRMQVQRLKELSSQLQAMMGLQIKAQQQRAVERDRMKTKPKPRSK